MINRFWSNGSRPENRSSSIFLCLSLLSIASDLHNFFFKPIYFILSRAMTASDTRTDLSTDKLIYISRSELGFFF